MAGRVKSAVGLLLLVAAVAVGLENTVRIDLEEHFYDPDGDPMTFEAYALDEQVVAVEVDGQWLVITGLLVGETVVKVRACDEWACSEWVDFRVVVVPAGGGGVDPGPEDDDSGGQGDDGGGDDDDAGGSTGGDSGPPPGPPGCGPVAAPAHADDGQSGTWHSHGPDICHQHPPAGNPPHSHSFM